MPSRGGPFCRAVQGVVLLTGCLWGQKAPRKRGWLSRPGVVEHFLSMHADSASPRIVLGKQPRFPGTQSLREVVESWEGVLAQWN